MRHSVSSLHKFLGEAGSLKGIFGDGDASAVFEKKTRRRRLLGIGKLPPAGPFKPALSGLRSSGAHAIPFYMLFLFLKKQLYIFPIVKYSPKEMRIFELQSTCI